MTRYLPIIPIPLDPRTEFTLSNEAKLRVVQASNGQITDISSGSVVSALMEGFAFSQAELLYYLNQMPEAYTATFLSQILGIQIISSEPSTVVLEFIRESAIAAQTPYLLSSGFRVQSNEGIVFETLSPINFNTGETIKYVLARSISEGSETNVSANSISTSLQGNNPQFSSITNPSPAYGGKDGESYNEAKARAFSQIKRRNPVSATDFAELVEDILGVGTKVRVGSKSSTPLIQLNNGSFIAAESDANTLLDVILAKKKSLGQESEVSSEDIKTVTSVISSATKSSEHIFISVRAADNSSIDPIILNRVRTLIQNRAPLGITVHLQNAMVQNVSIKVTLQNNDLTNTSDIENALESYFNELTFGSNLDFSVITSVVSNITNVINVTATTGTIIENENLSQESIVDNVVAELSKDGVIIFNRGRAGINSLNEGYYYQTDSYPAYADSVLWKLEAVTIIPSSESLSFSNYGTLLECRSGHTSVRSDGRGGTYLTEDDRSCGYEKHD